MENDRRLAGAIPTLLVVDFVGPLHGQPSAGEGLRLCIETTAAVGRHWPVNGCGAIHGCSLDRKPLVEPAQKRAVDGLGLFLLRPVAAVLDQDLFEVRNISFHTVGGGRR